MLFDSDYKEGTYASDSPLRFIFSQPSLKWAWLLALFFIITFMLFNAKRRQRAIKIITPLRNTTVQFTKTVANLYYESKDHTNIIDKKMKNGLGVMLDDIIAGIYSAITIYIFYALWF